MRIRIDNSGTLEIVDPDFSVLPLLQELDSEFTVKEAPLPNFSIPRFLACRYAETGIEQGILSELPTDMLWQIHDKAMDALNPARPLYRENDDKSTVSLLEIKMELADRLLKNCCLCARRCGVNRSSGDEGFCGLGAQVLLAGCAPHIAEEPPINPSLLVSLYGCALRCRYCQQSTLLHPPCTEENSSFTTTFWEQLNLEGVRSLSFIGGNPDESLPGILRLLHTAPSDWQLPIVWNCHAYSSPETLLLLEGIVDCYVPDFRYGSEACAIALSQALGYPRVAAAAIRSMLAQQVPVIVRILVLPGHTECCHIPALQELARMNAPNLMVSIRGQYCPDGQISAADGVMGRRITQEEVQTVETYAADMGLSRIT